MQEVAPRHDLHANKAAIKSVIQAGRGGGTYRQQVGVRGEGGAPRLAPPRP